MAKLRFSKTKASELLNQCAIAGSGFVRLKQCPVPGYAAWMATGEAVAVQLAGTPKKVEHCVIAIEVSDDQRPLVTRRNVLLAKLIYCHILGSDEGWQGLLETAQHKGQSKSVTAHVETALTFDSHMGTLSIRFSALPISGQGHQWITGFAAAETPQSFAVSR